MVYKCFARVYNCKAKYHLPGHWLLLVRLADIPGMLSFLNEDNPPKEWIDDIITDIDTALLTFRKQICLLREKN